MPLRGFLYFARQYEKYVIENECNLFGRKRVPIPTPQYVVFYNGDTWSEERKVVKAEEKMAKAQEEIAQKDEFIRSLKEELARVNKK